MDKLAEGKVEKVFYSAYLNIKETLKKSLDRSSGVYNVLDPLKSVNQRGFVVLKRSQIGTSDSHRIPRKIKEIRKNSLIDHNFFTTRYAV